MQQELDEEEKESRPKKPVQVDSDDEDPDIWKCKIWTLKNKLPKYRCKACDEIDNDAYDKYLKNKEKESKKRSSTNSSSYSNQQDSRFTNSNNPANNLMKTWTCRYWNKDFPLRQQFWGNFFVGFYQFYRFVTS